MSHYRSNVRDIEFNLFEVLQREKILGTAPYEDLDRETVSTILAEVERLATTKLAASFAAADLEPPVFDPATHTVTLPDAFKRSYQALMDSGTWQLELPAEIGGQVTPPTVQWAVNELNLGANPALYLYAAGPKFAYVLWANGTERDRRIAQIMIERMWGATMVLTEPDAGSDVGAGRTRAIPQPDGSWHIEGVKRFITAGEHDLTENIIHLVLARPVGVLGSADRAPRDCRCSSCPSTLRPGDGRAHRGAQRRVRHQSRAQDGDPGVGDLRAHLRRRCPGPRLAAR